MELLKHVSCDEELVNRSAHSLFGKASEGDMFAWVSDFEGKNIHSMFLANRINRVARGFYALGLEPGERVALFLPKMPHAISCFYALSLMGAVAVFLDPHSSEDEAACAIDALDCQMVVACDFNKGRVSSAAGQVYPGIPVVVASFGEDQMFPRNALYPFVAKKDSTPVSREASLISWRKFMDIAKKSGPVDVPSVSGDCPVCVMMENGDDGAAKSVQYTNKELNAVACKVAEVSGHSLADDPFYSDAPLHTFAGLALGVHAPIANQGYCVIDARDSVASKVKLMLGKKPSGVYGTPELYRTLMESSEFAGAKLSFLKDAFCSGLSAQEQAVLRDFLTIHGSKAALVAID